MRRFVAVLLCSFALAGCPMAREAPVTPIAIGDSLTATIGAAGGSLSVGSMEIVVPPGALATDTEISVEVVAGGIPGVFTGYSPLVHFEPEGLTFAQPIEVRIPFEGDARTATVFWSQHAGDAFVPRPTRVEHGYAVAETTHFSQAFVGTACEGDDCCDAANGELDLLLVVDDSNSMIEEQALLRAEIPRLARILASGDVDGDGVQDFPALSSIHMGVTSTDLGTGAIESVPSCDPGYGTDGLLLDAGGDLVGCEASYGSAFATYDEAAGSDVEAFATQVACVSALGSGGCGFEQQLEASLLALSPAAPTDYTGADYVPPTFVDGRAPHGDGANDGFLRTESMMVVLQLTDENDTSVSDLSIFDPTSAEYASIPLNLRGTAEGGVTEGMRYPVSRYVDGLLALRESPANVIFGLVGGVPAHLVADPANVDFETLLAAPEMQERLDTSTTPPTRLAAACEDATGFAMPARRLAEVASGIETAGGSAVVGSICEPDMTAVIDGLLRQIAARASGRCGG